MEGTLVDVYIYLAPDSFFGATMLMCTQLTFQLDASSVDKKVLRATAAAIGQATFGVFESDKVC